MFHTDRIDLLLIHRPDPLLNPEEVAEAFGLLKQNGKVLHFGVSNFTPTQFEMLQRYLPFPLVTNQLEISLTHHEPLFDGSLDTLMKHRVGAMAWSPLGGGKLIKEGSQEMFNKTARYGATQTQLSLAWLLRHPANIFPVIGTTKPERITESAKAIDIQSRYSGLVRNVAGCSRQRDALEASSSQACSLPFSLNLCLKLNYNHFSVISAQSLMVN